MKTISRLASVFFVVFLLFENVQAQVKSDYDKSIDFTQFSAYTFEGWEKNSDKILTDFDKKRITNALQNEFSARGMKLVASEGDVAITLYIVINDKTSTTAYTDFNGGFGYGVGRWGWGMGPGFGVGMGTATTTYDQNDYKEGTFVVDMYDANGKKLIWQGVITSVVQEKPEKRDKTIPKKIKKLMKSYPVNPKK